MAGKVAIRVISLLLSAAGSAFCQQIGRLGGTNSLPDAPSVPTLGIQTPGPAQTLRALLDTSRLPVDTLNRARGGSAAAGHLQYGRFEYEPRPVRKEAQDLSASTPTLLNRNHSYHASTSGSLLGRVSYAASSIVITRDDDGKSRLNTSYLLTVLTTAAAHSAYRPYWRRSATQPFSDFGSTVGSDAGMNVFHEFKPGLLQLVKNHEPRFVSKIEEKARR